MLKAAPVASRKFTGLGARFLQEVCHALFGRPGLLQVSMVFHVFPRPTIDAINVSESVMEYQAPLWEPCF
jgi:hypothetical protein